MITCWDGVRNSCFGRLNVKVAVATLPVLLFLPLQLRILLNLYPLYLPFQFFVTLSHFIVSAMLTSGMIDHHEYDIQVGHGEKSHLSKGRAITKSDIQAKGLVISS